MNLKPWLRSAFDSAVEAAVELGTSGVALGPLFASHTHGYDTTDHYRIDPRLGDDADFDQLISEAHKRGLRVLLEVGVVTEEIGRAHV